MEKQLGFKIDFHACKNSADGTILSKVREFQNHVREHNRIGINIYSKPPVISGCDREVAVLYRFTGLPKKMLILEKETLVN